MNALHPIARTDPRHPAAAVPLSPPGPAREPCRAGLEVAFVTETYPPEVNGVSMTVAQVVAGLRSRGHRVQLVRPRQPVDAMDAEGAAASGDVLVRGMPIPRYPHLRLGLPAGHFLRSLWTLQRPDVVHIATEGPLGLSALRAARALKLPVTTDFRTNFHAYSQHYGLGWFRQPIMGYLRRVHNAAAATMVPTEPLRQELETAGFQRVSVVARGVDARRFDPARRSAALRARWGVAPDDPVVAFVGRLAPEKNLSLLERAFAGIVAREPRARLLLVGDGPLHAELRERLPRAVLAGQRAGDDLAAHYASADLFLFPSLTETFGNVTTEAMASGLPVVAFNHAAAAQLIAHGESGLLVPYGDAEAFRAAALELGLSRARRLALGRAARARALLQDWDEVTGRFEAVLVQAMIGQRVTGARGRVVPSTA
jgi:glycosyltransferase involved in cell wall biosynthesis